jgi:PAS domain S-box-containing protein
MSGAPEDPHPTELSLQIMLPGLRILDSFVHKLVEGVVVADRSGRVIFANRAAQSILGLGSTGLVQEKWSEVYGCFRPDKLTPFPSAELPLARALLGESVSGVEIFIRNPSRPAGLWIITDGSPLMDDSGALIGGVVVFRDLTRRKETEQKIERLTSAVEQTADSIVITDRYGIIEYVNPAFEQTTGYTRREVLGSTPRLLKSGSHPAEFYAELWQRIQSGQVFRGTIMNRKKSGEIYHAEQTITPMRDSGGTITHFVSVIKDITEQRKLREQEFHMGLARAVQQRFYCVPSPSIPGFDLAGAALPAGETGGDYFDFVPLPGNRVGVSIGDVSGHGVASALLMVQVRACLRAFARRAHDPGRILKEVNEALVTDAEQNSYATIALCSLDPSSRRFVYANAGHVPGYVVDADGSVKHVLDSNEVPLGIFPDASFEVAAPIELQPGDILILLTDGVTEARRPDDSEFGVDRALDCVRRHRQENAQQIVAELLQAVRDFSGGSPQADDITAVICKCLAQDGPFSGTHREPKEIKNV